MILETLISTTILYILHDTPATNYANGYPLLERQALARITYQTHLLLLACDILPPHQVHGQETPL